MALPVSLLERTRDAILAVFERDDLRCVVRTCLALSFDVLTPDKALDHQVGELLGRLDDTGNLPQLLACLAAERPQNAGAGGGA